jgi:hypothetical protein
MLTLSSDGLKTESGGCRTQNTGNEFTSSKESGLRGREQPDTPQNV